MDQEITIIHEDPIRRLIAFGADGLVTQHGELFANLISDGIILSGVCSGTNDEEIRKTGYLRNVEDFDVEGFFGLGSTDGRENFGGDR